MKLDIFVQKSCTDSKNVKNCDARAKLICYLNLVRSSRTTLSEYVGDHGGPYCKVQKQLVAFFMLSAPVFKSELHDLCILYFFVSSATSEGLSARHPK